ncbi:hypothetical protein GCM10007923_64300 [Shinella yambaruensis]|uniref:Uncharacterized protein n=2 Tax=Shinella yambaruensis TaxID=415996 RepID=A0ABQ5ZR98_9HYPH|nr:hypothetical protein GCM10007923_64300 [Shinella yambaruensis]
MNSINALRWNILCSAVREGRVVKLDGHMTVVSATKDAIVTRTGLGGEVTFHRSGNIGPRFDAFTPEYFFANGERISGPPLCGGKP